MTLRTLQRAAHRQADAMAARFPRPLFSIFIATVATVTVGAAADGNALVSVTWRGSEVEASGYASSYTPGVGHRVLCIVVFGQLIVAFRIVGYPATT